MKTLNLKLYLITLGGSLSKKDDDSAEAKAALAYSIDEAMMLLKADPAQQEAVITRIVEQREIDYLTDRPIDYEKYS